MNSAIFTGEVFHIRRHPVEHTFRYPTCFFAVDLDELPVLEKISGLIRHNGRAVLSLWDRDYLHPGEEPLRTKVSRVLLEAGINTEGWRRTVLTTSPRYFGYIFNPVSFFLCFDEHDRLFAAIANVNNTFSESHLYVLSRDGNGDRFQCRACKEFHVSPFFEVRGEYEFGIDVSGFESPPHSENPRLEITISMTQDGRQVFHARLSGEGTRISGPAIRSSLRTHPLTAVLSFPRIVLQAKRLWWNRKLAWLTRPAPQSRSTVRRPGPKFLDRIGESMFRRIASRLDARSLPVEFPDRTRQTFGDPTRPPAPQITIRDRRFFDNLLLHGHIGFCESFVAKDFECEDITGLFEALIENEQVMESAVLAAAGVLRPFFSIAHWLRRNSVRQAERNIHAHYDLGNDFYRSFLDDRMFYSSAVFDREGLSLEDAQLRKAELLLERARLEQRHHLLEIGCGWGSLAIEAARRYGCRVTGVTISKEQHRYAIEQVRAAGLEHLVTIRYGDYRTLSGTFDRIVSCEMIEAVGERYLARFFSVCDRLLAPDGILVLQAITMNEQGYDIYRRSVDWIRHSIFPGGHLPSVGALMNAVGRSSALRFDCAEDIGIHYAETLSAWRARFLRTPERRAAAETPCTLERRWMLYLCYCEAAFRTRYLGTHQIVFAKIGAQPQIALKHARIPDTESGVAPAGVPSEPNTGRGTPLGLTIQ